ncbi:MAG: macro domain-containing protein [Planctomycetes bacterium]|nr:macro domain-containing protein [Planctomycetota bacterium]
MWLRGLERNPCRFLRINELLRILFFTDLPLGSRVYGGRIVGSPPPWCKSLGDFGEDWGSPARKRVSVTDSSLPCGSSKLELVRGNILDQPLDALVTAANSGLLGGGGVDGAIHRAAGPDLLAACREVGGCPTGDAVATAPGALPLTCVVHAVGPIYGAHDGAEADLLASAHRRALEVAAAAGARSVAFPAISCGVYGYPLAEAAPIGLGTIAAFLDDHPEVELVRYVLYGREEYEAFAHALEALRAARG